MYNAHRFCVKSNYEFVGFVKPENTQQSNYTITSIFLYISVIKLNLIQNKRVFLFARM